MSGDGPADHRARQRLVLRLAELGVPTTDTEGQRHVVAVWTRGAAQRRSELTERQAGSLLARLREMTADDVAAVLALPRPAAPACPVEDEDAGTCWLPAVQCCTAGAGEPEDPADVPEPAPPAEVVEHLADVVELRPALVEPEPVPPAAEPPRVYPVAPPVVDVEAAAIEAVERHRAAVAAGVVLQPPTREEIPPRVAVPTPSNPGRSCPPAVCYCTECPTYKPAPPMDYSKVPGSRDYEEMQRWRR